MEQNFTQNSFFLSFVFFLLVGLPFAHTQICTDPNLYAGNCDFDGDGILNSVDPDDDNDGVLDAAENTCIPPDNDVRPDIGWDINQNAALPGLVQLDSTGSYTASNNNVVVGAGLTLDRSDVSVAIWDITGINQTTLAGAIANDDFLEFGFTTSATAPLLRLEDWRTFVGQNIVNNGRTLDNVAIQISDNNFATPGKALFTGAAPTSGNWVANSVTNCILTAGTSYSVRLYVYNQSGDLSVSTQLDAFGLNFSCVDDTDNDGIPNQFDLDSDNDGCSDALSPAVFCDFVLANPTSALALADCDGGGISNLIECQNGRNPLVAGDDCQAALASGMNICTFILANPTSPLALADCDGGGISNITECIAGANPLNPSDDCQAAIDANVDLCAILAANPNNALATADCDGGGIANNVECFGLDGIPNTEDDPDTPFNPLDPTDDSASVIPTMTEWGLMIFGLLILNMSVIFLYRREQFLVG